MKILKRILLLLVVIITIFVIYNYPKLNMLAGYSAKNTASSVFLGERTLAFTDQTDNSFSPVNLATDKVDKGKKLATSSAFGLLTRKAVYRKGLGSVLILDESDVEADYLVPIRTKPDDSTPFPFGNGAQKDSVFKNINYSQLEKAMDFLFEEENQTRAGVIIYKNQIIAERYADGFDKNSKLLGWSMTKSITGTIFGILQSQGKINVQDLAPIESWQDDERSKITIHNLLQMNSGLEWDENYDEISDATRMLFLERDMTKEQQRKELVGKPNATWNYSSGTTNLLSGIIKDQFKTHQEYLDFWYTNLIDKIGMNSMVIEADLSGNYVGSSYAWATARDWAKFGILYLNRGNWNGEPIFDESWTDYVVDPTPTSDGWYGAQFWLNSSGRYPDAPKNMFFASGFQGQNVYILPDEELVIVRLSLTKKANQNEFLKGVLKSIQ
ncbi:serine hydrolase [uncultured Polaribacter sp.]|uniref:serine hydrolase domain-containing protein n=1 Tax=uncultured Polaribacter sp. TaxID=174711 RepID=UPI00260C9528|nr:serine hydrolase [uncultured Polaribacter sp.]